ncbi:hypothetical protein F5888DRAFT_672083 [Russula emetica]|nr:hypothetical protein F5888DRAFT_672083 [Russula emetica]
MVFIVAGIGFCTDWALAIKILFKEPLRAPALPSGVGLSGGNLVYEGLRGTRAGVCVLSLSPICGSRTHFLREGVKLDSDYSGSASLPNFSHSSSLRGFIPFSGWFSVFGSCFFRATCIVVVFNCSRGHFIVDCSTYMDYSYHRPDIAACLLYYKRRESRDNEHIAVVSDHMEFLRVATNDPHQFQCIRDIVDSFEFPASTVDYRSLCSAASSSNDSFPKSALA